MLNRITALSLLTLLALVSTAYAHGGKTHVVGHVSEVDSRNFAVEDTSGKTVSIRTTTDTRYFVGKLKATSEQLRVGRRIAVDVFGQKGDYSAKFLLSTSSVTCRSLAKTSFARWRR